MDDGGSKGRKVGWEKLGTKPVGSIELGEVDGWAEADKGRGTGVDF